MVDTGNPGSAPKVLAALAAQGFRPSDVSLIVITHRHVDHIGAAAALQRATGAPVAVHALDADGLRRGDGGDRRPKGWAGRVFDLTPFPSERAEPTLRVPSRSWSGTPDSDSTAAPSEPDRVGAAPVA